jgi:transcriptional regulator with XRE-family HTH domain
LADDSWPTDALLHRSGYVVFATMLSPLVEEMGIQLREQLGARLRQIRVWRKLRVDDVEAQSGLTSQYIYVLERGDGNPTMQVLVGLALVYRVDVADFFAFPSRKMLRHRARDLVRFVPNSGLVELVKQMESLAGTTFEQIEQAHEQGGAPQKRSTPSRR